MFSAFDYRVFFGGAFEVFHFFLVLDRPNQWRRLNESRSRLSSSSEGWGCSVTSGVSLLRKGAGRVAGMMFRLLFWVLFQSVRLCEWVMLLKLPRFLVRRLFSHRWFVRLFLRLCGGLSPRRLVSLPRYLNLYEPALTPVFVREGLEKGKRPVSCAERLLLASFLMLEQEFPAAQDLLGPLPAEKDDRFVAAYWQVRAELAFELGDLVQTQFAVDHAAGCDLQWAQQRHVLLKGAYTAGLCKATDRALYYFALQYGLPDPATAVPAPQPEQWVAENRDAIEAALLKEVLACLGGDVAAEMARPGPEGRIGVFFLNSPAALGHAILDPYHFLALNQGKFSKVYFIGPARSNYSPGTRVCLEIVEQYGEYVETDSDMLANLSWLYLGEMRFGAMSLWVHHYWSQLREVVHRVQGRMIPAHDLNAYFLDIPLSFRECGDAFCLRHGLDRDRPIVTLHVRDHGYHRLSKQAFRNANFANYLPAIHDLLDAGFQVVRLGDTRMTKASVERPGYLELPFAEGYDPSLDPYFIRISRFMIGCQSGPCSYARALGVPVLSLNAVYHYTLVPAYRELSAYKQYVEIAGESRRVLGGAEILQRNLFHLENGFQFSRARIETEDMGGEEIRAAVQDAIAWFGNPDLPETDGQIRFRALCREAADRIATQPDIVPPLADYLALSLRNYRIAPSLVLSRPGWI